MNASFLRAILADISLISADLVKVADELRACARRLNDGDEDDVPLHLLVDYTHRFVLSASIGKDNPFSIDDFLRGVDWVLARTD